MVKCDSRHSNVYLPCTSSRRLVPLFVWGRIHTRALHEQRTESSIILEFQVALYGWYPFTNTCGDYVDHICSIELEVKDTTDTARSSVELDLHPENDSKVQNITTKESIWLPIYLNIQ